MKTEPTINKQLLDGLRARDLSRQEINDRMRNLSPMSIQAGLQRLRIKQLLFFDGMKWRLR